MMWLQIMLQLRTDIKGNAMAYGIYYKPKNTLSPVHTMKLLYETQCCRHKFHCVYVRETCFKRFLEFHETDTALFLEACFILLQTIT